MLSQLGFNRVGRMAAWELKLDRLPTGHNPANLSRPKRMMDDEITGLGRVGSAAGLNAPIYLVRIRKSVSWLVGL